MSWGRRPGARGQEEKRRGIYLTPKINWNDIMTHIFDTWQGFDVGDKQGGDNIPSWQVSRYSKGGTDIMTRRKAIGWGPMLRWRLGIHGLTEAFADEPQGGSGKDKPHEAPHVTNYVAEFIVNTRYTDLPPEVIELAKKSILDGIGLALSGSVAKSGRSFAST